MIKPQDILVLLKLVVLGNKDWVYNKVAVELDMSSSEVHAACKRALAANLAIKQKSKITPNIRNLEEFVTHGLKYVFVAQRGEMTRGIPTAHAAAPLSGLIVGDDEPVPVWPDANGKVRGMAFLPLYKSAPQAALKDDELYQMLALVDAIRGGKARERNIALEEFKLRLNQYG
jgi:hypothetical protein